MRSISYTLIGDGLARLDLDTPFQTGIRGHYIDEPWCLLSMHGQLTVREGFVWDFATGAIDTPAMVSASLCHDALCLLTDAGLLPWGYRRTSDRLFREQLRALGVGPFRAWYAWVAVRGWSLWRGLRR